MFDPSDALETTGAEGGRSADGVARRRTAVAVAAVLLLALTGLVFWMLDRNSHSASDTLRPFIIIVVPMWAVALTAARALLGHRQ